METSIKSTHLLHTSFLETPIGTMMAIGDEEALYLLEFADNPVLEKEMARLKGATLLPGSSSSIRSIEKELAHYFAGKLKEFKTPLCLSGTPFQISVWKELCRIPFGKTRSFSDMARALDRPTAFRAVARSNGANQHSIIIPCHRVINSDGSLSGYSGGVARKQWLLDHERKWLV